MTLPRSTTFRRSDAGSGGCSTVCFPSASPQSPSQDTNHLLIDEAARHPAGEPAIGLALNKKKAAVVGPPLTFGYGTPHVAPTCALDGDDRRRVLLFTGLIP